MTPNEIAELISLALTSPMVISSLLVVSIFWKPAWRALLATNKTPSQWLILGVTASFIGGIFDNLWWGSAWARHYLENDSRHWWFNYGVYSNIPFRQIAGIIAAVCHIKSVWGAVEEKRTSWKLLSFNVVMIAATIGSFIFWVLIK